MRNEMKPPTLPAAAIAALGLGKKIDAIKVVRRESGTDLKDAKDLVEAYVRSNPELQSSFAAAQSEAGRTALWWLVAIVGAVVLGFILIKR